MKMKRACILIIMTILMASLLFWVTGCNNPATTTETTAVTATTAAETTAAATTAAAETTAQKEIEVIYVCPMTSHPVYQEVQKGAEAAAKDNGFKLFYTGATDHSVEGTVEALENAIAQKPDAIVTIPFSPSAFTPSLERAKAAGIPVIAVAIDAERPDLRATYIGTDQKSTGVTVAKALIGKAGEDMQVGVIVSNLDAANQIIAIDALKGYIKDYPGAAVIDTQEDLADLNKAIEVFSAMITANPTMNALFGAEGTGAPAFGKVLEEKGLLGKISVVAMDDTGENLPTLEAGKIDGLIAQNFYNGWGYAATKYAWQAALGQTTPKEVDSGNVLITKDNIDTYKSQMEIKVLVP
jgi:ABC-type sugar transport system substrate-binding protein